jgi:hypothetical protein
MVGIFDWIVRSTQPVLPCCMNALQRKRPIPGGAIVRARGVTPTQGWWNAELVAKDTDQEGVLLYEFRLLPPAGSADVNTQQSREIDVAIFVSDVKLASVREIVVQGATNARSSRR